MQEALCAPVSEYIRSSDNSLVCSLVVYKKKFRKTKKKQPALNVKADTRYEELFNAYRGGAGFVVDADML